MAGLQASFLKRTGIINTILMAVVAGIACWLAAWALLGDSVAYLGFINAGGLVYGFVALAAGLVLLFRRRWIIGVSGLALAIFLLAYPSGTNIAASEDRLLPSDIRIMSASLRGLNQDMAGTAAHLAQYDADIIGLQEVYDANAFKTALENTTQKTWYMAVQGKLTILAAFPVTINAAPVQSILSAQIAIPGRTLTVWTLRAPKAYQKPLVNRQFFSALAKEIDVLEPDAVIGDFNASPWNHGYSTMDAKMVNAQKAGGFGAGSSFPGPARNSGLLGAFARIDHVFVRQERRIVNAFTGTAYKTSDHHPVVADLRLAKQAVSAE